MAFHLFHTVKGGTSLALISAASGVKEELLHRFVTKFSSWNFFNLLFALLYQLFLDDSNTALFGFPSNEHLFLGFSVGTTAPTVARDSLNGGGHTAANPQENTFTCISNLQNLKTKRLFLSLLPLLKPVKHQPPHTVTLTVQQLPIVPHLTSTESHQVQTWSSK